MDKVNRYRDIARAVIEEVAAMIPQEKETETQTVFDEKRGHYLLMEVGWRGTRWQYTSIIHIDVKENGRVWLQHDGTDLKIALWMVERGIPKSDIVLGFHMPADRARIEEFAVA